MARLPTAVPRPIGDVESDRDAAVRTPSARTATIGVLRTLLQIAVVVAAILVLLPAALGAVATPALGAT